MKRNYDDLFKPATIKDKIKDRISNTMVDKVKKQFGYELYIKYPANDSNMKLIYNFLTRYDREPEYHFDNYIKGTPTAFKMNASTIIMIDKQTFVYVASGNKVPTYDYALSHDQPIYVYFYIFGKNSFIHYHKLHKKYHTILDDPTTIESLSVKGVTGRDYFEVVSSDVKVRDLNTLYYEEDIKGRILNHINNFKNNNSLLLDRGVKFKTSILLHGDPGTGKSSIISSLAGYLRCDIVNVDISTIHLINVAKLSGSIDESTKDGTMMIILLEDIDTMMLNRETTEDKDYLTATQNLLQLMDSNISPNNVIFIATTNHIDKLDEAILRPGRLDLHLKVTGISKPNIIKMIKSFKIPDDNVENVLYKINNDPTVKKKGLDLENGDLIQQAIIQKYIIDEYILINGISDTTLLSSETEVEKSVDDNKTMIDFV